MPLVHLFVPRHLPAAQVRALADAVHEGLVATCHIPSNDRFQLIARYAPEDMIIDSIFPNVSRSRDVCIVEIKFLAGHAKAEKRALYRFVVDQAVAIGMRPDDVFITLTENQAIDWSPGRGEAFAGHTKPA